MPGDAHTSDGDDADDPTGDRLHDGDTTSPKPHPRAADDGGEYAEGFASEPLTERRYYPEDTPQGVLEDVQGLYSEKNDDYGNSWEKTGVLKRVLADADGPRLVTLHPDGRYEVESGDLPFHIADADATTMSDADPVEAVVLATPPAPQSAFEQNADGLLTRLLDKFTRVHNLLFLADDREVDDESVADTAADITGYGSMLASLLRRR